MAYYDSVHTHDDFANTWADVGMNFEDLQKSRYWETAASRWGLLQLLACRVLCRQPTETLPLLANRIKSGMEDNADPCIKKLLDGPTEDLSTLRKMPEHRIVRAYDPDGLGSLWSALAALLHQGQSHHQTMSSNRPARDQTQTIIFGDFVPSDQIVTGTLPDGPATESSKPSSVGYMEKEQAPLVEEYTVRFASSLIRTILNYCQPLDKSRPLEYRDERVAYDYKEPPQQGQDSKRFRAIDDGGVQLRDRITYRTYHIAMLEAKRTFQELNGNSPTVSNEFLAQLVGEALARRSDDSKQVISKDDIITIVAVKHYVKLFHFNITESFLTSFSTLSPDTRNTYLKVDSTGWWDMTDSVGRKYFVRHMLALVSLVDDAVETGLNRDDSEDDVDMED